MLTLVLGGGNALGAFHGGVIEASQRTALGPNGSRGPRSGRRAQPSSPATRRKSGFRRWPRRIADSAERQNDLAFGYQTVRTLRAMRQLWESREGPPGAVYAFHYRYQESEIAMKTYDFSQSSLDRRWARGRESMRNALRLWRERPPAGRGLAIHTVEPMPEPEPA